MIHQYIKAMKNPMFASRDSVQEAYEYAIALAENKPEVVVALQVMMNTIANDLEVLVREEEMKAKKSELEQIVEGWVNV